jgi:phage baseplate assembly protein W
MATVPQLAWPFQIGADGAPATVAQDSLEELAQSVELIVTTRSGERLGAPRFGVPDPVGRRDASLVEIVAAIAEHEPRVDATVTAQRIVDGDPLAQAITIGVARKDLT